MPQVGMDRLDRQRPWIQAQLDPFELLAHDHLPTPDLFDLLGQFLGAGGRVLRGDPLGTLGGARRTEGLASLRKLQIGVGELLCEVLASGLEIATRPFVGRRLFVQPRPGDRLTPRPFLIGPATGTKQETSTGLPWRRGT